MLLNSLTQAISLFSQTWVLVALLFLLIFYAFVSWALKKGTPQTQAMSGAGPGCLLGILTILVQSLVLALVLILLMPIFLDQRETLSWSLVEPLGFVGLRAGLVAALFLGWLSFFPWVGKVLGNSPGLELFLGSSLCYYLILPYYLELYLGQIPFEMGWTTAILLLLPYLGLFILLKILLLFIKKFPGRVFVELGLSWFLFLAFLKRLSLEAQLF